MISSTKNFHIDNISYNSSAIFNNLLIVFKEYLIIYHLTLINVFNKL